jgi:L-amino acid N-acyltransferase YncA
MKVRFAETRDMEALVDMTRRAAENRPHLTYNETRARATFADYMLTARPALWVAESNGEIYGLLMADFYVYRCFDGLFTTQDVLYVKPEKRGTRAAALLMRELISWSKELGAREIIGGNDNEFDSDRTAKFLSRFGFRKVGHAMQLEL